MYYVFVYHDWLGGLFGGGVKVLINIICQIKRDKTFHLRNSKTSNGVW